MLKINFKGKLYQVFKSSYLNERIAIIFKEEENNEEYINSLSLTINIPEAHFMSEMYGEYNEYDAFINHIDGIPYFDIFDWLEENELIEKMNTIDEYGYIKSGFNKYAAVRFKKEKVRLMEEII